MASLSYQTPTAVTTKVGTPTAIPMIPKVSSPEELEAEVGAGLECEVEADEGAGLEDEVEVGFCVEVVGAAGTRVRRQGTTRGAIDEHIEGAIRVDITA